MRIAMIGSGNVGGTLGRRFTQVGHEVTFAARNPESSRLADLRATMGPDFRVETIARAAANAEIVVLATPWAGTIDAIDAAGGLAGKIVIDCTNPIAAGMSGLSVGTHSSGAEQVAARVPGARVVKGFSTTGSMNMANPDYRGDAITMFLCGDDPEAKAIVASMAAEIGFEPIDAGELRVARYLEPLAMLWVHLAYVQGMGPNIAINLSRR
ncbi:MAG: NADPH-dependent F420 reductase [Deltaproteobacteria bacterium]|nr:NADPH-dependent F420 reductase [Deltaproteobacteria bacterium]